ncbi:hypothetical protein ACHAXH_002153 [Discostella pseudostelligera]
MFRFGCIRVLVAVCLYTLQAHGLALFNKRLGTTHRHDVHSTFQLNLLGNNNLLDTLFSLDIKFQQWPKVEAPPNFVVPEPRPLTITESTNLGGFISSSAALALRLATGAFVLGWKVDTIFAPDDGKYALQLGPLRIRDSSSVLDQASPPVQTIILYDNESSPTCKRVREMMNLLDITYECRPVFGPEIDNLPRIDDPNLGGTISGDDEIIQHLLKQYGPSSSLFDIKALWPITFKEFSLATSQLAIMLRGNTGAMQQTNARPDNVKMRPIQLWAYECSPFV